MTKAKIYLDRCPICCGPKDEKHINCFHCTQCEIFEACNYLDDPIAEYLNLIEQRLVAFYKDHYKEQIKAKKGFVRFMKKYIKKKPIN